MAGLVPAMTILCAAGDKDVDARDKPGHDQVSNRSTKLSQEN